MMQIDQSLVGRVFTTLAPVHITAEMIAGFCEVTGETNPLYISNPNNGGRGEAVAPPAFAAAFRALEDIFRQIPRDAPRLAAGMDVEFVEPIRAGDAITVSSQLAETYQKTGRSGPMTFIVIRSVLTNQNGEIVARIDHQFTYRG